MQYLDDIITGKVCPYCGGKSELIDSAHVYRMSYGNVWACLPCDAFVGVHKGSDVALGRLANAELREAKKEAHKLFDKLWRRKMERTLCSKSTARAAAYKWLGEQMELEAKYCHIGMFTVEQCMQAIAICKPFI